MPDILGEAIREYDRRRNLLEALLVEIKQVESTGQFVELATAPVQPEEEEVISVITAPYLKAFMTVVGQRVAAAKIVLEAEPSADGKQRTIEDANLVQELMWDEIRASFGEAGDAAIVGLRVGWTLVRKREEPSEVFPFPPGLSRFIKLIGGNCGNPNCPVHHPETASAQAPASAAN